jgi:hypothetical protein
MQSEDSNFCIKVKENKSYYGTDQGTKPSIWCCTVLIQPDHFSASFPHGISYVTAEMLTYIPSNNPCHCRDKYALTQTGVRGSQLGPRLGPRH